MGIRIYFDTNVFGDFLAGGPADQRRVLEGKVRGEIEIVMSVLNLEEALGAETRDPELSRRLIRIIRHWCSEDLFLKPTDMLLKDDIASYAHGGTAVSPFISGEMLNEIRRGMDGLLSDPSPEGAMERLDALLKACEQKRSSKLRFEAVVPELREAAKGHKAQGMTFEIFFCSGRESVARAFADKCGLLREYNRRGLEGLLGLTSIHAAAGILLSNIYALTFEGREPKLADNRDLAHFTLAAASAQTFVTEDYSLAYRSRRVPIDGFNIWKREEFLASLPPSRI